MFGKKKNPATYDEKYLLQELMMTKKAMYTAYSNLDNVTDPDLIDCYIYQLNSEQKRYNYLLAKACDNTLFGKCNYTTTVRLPKEEGKTYYDTQRIEIPADKCATLNGIYEYKTALGEKKTVPVVEFDDFRLPNPNFEN